MPRAIRTTDQREVELDDDDDDIDQLTPEASLRWQTNQSRAKRATSSSVRGSSNRSVLWRLPLPCAKRTMPRAWSGIASVASSAVDPVETVPVEPAPLSIVFVSPPARRTWPRHRVRRALATHPIAAGYGPSCQFSGLHDMGRPARALPEASSLDQTALAPQIETLERDDKLVVRPRPCRIGHMTRTSKSTTAYVPSRTNAPTNVRTGAKMPSIGASEGR